PWPVAQQRHSLPRVEKYGGADEMARSDEEIVSAPEECEEQPRGIQLESKVVVGESCVAEPVPREVLQDCQPAHQCGGRQKKPEHGFAIVSAIFEAIFIEKPRGKDEWHDDSCLLNHHERHAGQSTGPEAILQKKKESERSESHRRHVELGQNRLGIEERRDAEQRERRKSGCTGAASGEFNCEQECHQRAE